MLDEFHTLKKQLAAAKAGITKAERTLKGAQGGMMWAQSAEAKAEAPIRLQKAEAQFKKAEQKELEISIRFSDIAQKIRSSTTKK